jgi:hypothetical protein
VDEMSVRIQQKSDEYKQQLSNLTDEFNSREEELRKQIKAFQVILCQFYTIRSAIQEKLFWL